MHTFHYLDLMHDDKSHGTTSPTASYVLHLHMTIESLCCGFVVSFCLIVDLCRTSLVVDLR